MKRDERGNPLLEPNGLPSQCTHSRRAAEQRLRRGRAETDDQLGLYGSELEREPVAARLHLGPVRLVVDALLSAGRRAPVEVLDGVREIRLLISDLCLGEELAEELPGRADERMALYSPRRRRVARRRASAAGAGPSPKTVCVPSFHRSQRLQSAASRRSFAIRRSCVTLTRSRPSVTRKAAKRPANSGPRRGGIEWSASRHEGEGARRTLLPDRVLGRGSLSLRRKSSRRHRTRGIVNPAAVPFAAEASSKAASACRQRRFKLSRSGPLGPPA